MSNASPILETLEPFVQDGWMPGAAWRVDAGEATLARGAIGTIASAADAADATPETVYDLASLTKPLATVPLLLLADRDGELELAGPAAEWLPELTGSAYGGVTLDALARHAARLPAWAPLYLDADGPEGFAVAIARQAPIEDAERYSDLGYILLGLALERACDAPLPRLFESRIARPLSLERTRFARSAPIRDAAPTERGNGYERTLAGRPAAEGSWRTELIVGQVHDGNAHALGGAAGHAGLFGPVDEVARIVRVLTGSSEIDLGAERIERVLRVPPGATRTFGLEAAAASDAARGVLPDAAPGHTGFTGTSIWLEPERRRTYVLLANRVHPHVQERGFQPVRRAFHRQAASLGAG